MSVDRLLEFLHRLEQSVVPFDKNHHSIFCAHYRDSDGTWRDTLALQIRDKILYLDADDFEKTTEQLLANTLNVYWSMCGYSGVPGRASSQAEVAGE